MRFPLVESVGGKQAAPALHGVLERRLLVDRLSPCIDQQREALRILDPGRDQSPAHQGELAFAVGYPHDRHRLGRGHIVAPGNSAARGSEISPGWPRARLLCSTVRTFQAQKVPPLRGSSTGY